MTDRRGEAADSLRFENREEAGRALALLLGRYVGRTDVVVLGLPRGGVPVAAEVAKALSAPLDVFVVRKIGAPGQPELAMGAIASGGVVVANRDVVRALGVSQELFDREAERERQELSRREQAYRGTRPPLGLEGNVAILVDDGLATGATIRAAARAARALSPARVVIAAPVGAPDTCRELQAEADEVVCARTPEPFLAVGQWYRDFAQTTDAEVRALLDRVPA
jgi:putative phosphoribosyl transferase